MPEPRPTPYKSTPVFDQDDLPEALRREHSTKAGVWGLLRVLEGQVRLIFVDPARDILVTPDRPAEIPPEEVHHVGLIGPVRMRVEFYRERPLAE